MDEIPELKDPEMDHNRVSRSGDFCLYFNKDLLGLVYMAPLNVEVNTNENQVSVKNRGRKLFEKE